MAIRLLDDRLINKIAAGEVVERPASIVKELVENSIDAGSTRIEVRISGGGIDLIEVVDNGAGITPAEVQLALQRHATSKISSEEDLYSIATMGFRGEALPSIAAVSRLELLTQSGPESGIRASLEGGRNLTIEPYPTAPGTHILVRDIFYNTPARRKFLKSTVSEGAHIYEVVSRLALARPDISFSLASEKKMYFKTPGNGILLDTVAAIFGQDFAASFLSLNWQGEGYALRGLISKPEFRRVNRKNQIFFVNQRIVKSPLLARAVDEGYRGRLLAREYPAVILYLTIDPHEVDVNVHPQKTEVRFREEKVVFRLISRAIQDRLEGNGASNTLIMEAGSRWSPGFINTPRPDHSPDRAYYLQNATAESRLAFPDFASAEQQESGEHLPRVGDNRAEHDTAIIGQCFNTYILVEKDDCLWMIDQHAAHERINYNRLRDNGNGSRTATMQMLAFPLVFELSGIHMDLLMARMPVFVELGFEIEALGPNSAVVRSAPVVLQGQEVETVMECLQLLEEDRSPDIKKPLFALLACKQSIKAGQALNRQEMAMLVRDLLSAEDYQHCPHGRPTMLVFNRGQLEKSFKRK